MPRSVAQLYLQYEQQAVVQNVELHEYRAKYNLENVRFGDSDGAERADKDVSAGTKANVSIKSRANVSSGLGQMHNGTGLVGGAALDVDMSRVTVRRPSAPQIEHAWDRRHQVIT